MYKKYFVSQLIKQAGILSLIGKGAAKGAKGTVNNILIPAADKTESLAETLGYNFGELTSVPDSDKELGPYKDVVQHLKDTELAEAYLRAAASLRRKARIIKRRRAEEEGLRSSVARSRFF